MSGPSQTPQPGEGLDPLSPREAALRRAGARRSAEAQTAAERGIRALLKDGGQVSFAAVARASGVSKSFLHAHPTLSERIRDLGQQQRGAPRAVHEQATTGEASVIAALRRHIADLEERHKTEVKELRRRLREQDHQIALLYGRLPKSQAPQPIPDRAEGTNR